MIFTDPWATLARLRDKPRDTHDLVDLLRAVREMIRGTDAAGLATSEEGDESLGQYLDHVLGPTDPLVRELMELRNKAKAAGNFAVAQAVKAALNTIYGQSTKREPYKNADAGVYGPEYEQSFPKVYMLTERQREDLQRVRLAVINLRKHIATNTCNRRTMLEMITAIDNMLSDVIALQ